MHNRSWRRRTLAARLLALLAVVAVAALQSVETAAQQSQGGSDLLNNLSPDQMLNMFSGGQGRTGAMGQTPGTQSQTTILEPLAPQNPALPQSRLELIMSTRAGVILNQFGYDQLGIGRPIILPEVGGMQDSYLLGPGDEVVVSLRGQENAEYRVQVDRDGTVVLPKLSPIPAAGRTLGDFRRDLISAVHRAYVSTEGYASVGRVRQISVIVAGEVGSPGVRTLTGLSSPIDAILVSGGIKKGGSLRGVRLIHGSHTTIIDLYAYLTNGVAAHPISLGDGDRIVVPTLGKTVAAAGWVRRPGIYELAPGQSATTVRQLTELAGGTEVRGRYRIEVLRVKANGETELAPITNESQTVADGDILLTLPEANQIVDRATLSGGTPLAGNYSIKSGMHLSDLLKAPGALGRSPYTVFGVISRRDPRTQLRQLIAFSPVAALSGQDDPALQSDDVIRIFSMNEARLLSVTLTQFEKYKQYREELTHNPFAASQPGTAGIESIGNETLDSISQANMQRSQVAQNAANGQPAGQIQASALTTSYDRLPPCSQVAQYQQMSPYGPYIPPQSQNPYPQMMPYGQISPYGETPSAPSPYVPSPPIMPYDLSAGTGGVPDLGPDTGSQSALAANPQLAGTSGAAAAQAAQAANQANPGGQALTPGLGNLNSPLRTPSVACLPAQNLEQELSAFGTYPTNAEARTLNQMASQLEVELMVLLNFLEDHEVTLDGAVRGPGAYVIGPDINLHDLVMVAGGTVHWADQSGVELISTSVNEQSGRATTSRRNLALNEVNLSSYVVSPHDELRFHQVFTDVGVGAVTLEGEVHFPGQYKIIRGEHLTDLLKRAGGLTDAAYPYGTVYLRRSVAALEEESFRRAAENVDNQLIVAMTHNGTNKLDSGAFSALQTFVNTLRTQKGLGRISITADPAVLAHKPEQNTVLESGDVIFIPQRPSTISVMGEVLQPGSFAYQPKLYAKDYLAKAGGFSSFADDSLTYIVLPDGSAEQLDNSGWLPFGGQTIPPGSVIVVPRDVAPVLWSDVIQNSSQIFSQLAIAGASLAVISENIH